MGLTELKSGCRQGHVPFWRLRGRGEGEGLFSCPAQLLRSRVHSLAYARLLSSEPAAASRVLFRMSSVVCLFCLPLPRGDPRDYIEPTQIIRHNPFMLKSAD